MKCAECNCDGNAENCTWFGKGRNTDVTTFLTDADWDAFNKATMEPPRPTGRMIDIIRRTSERIRNGTLVIDDDAL